jgi:uncharacterized protein YdeI (YjbR/CyaY-like superfamily)
MLGISEEVRNGAGVKGGDVIDIDLELDDKPRDVELPADFAAALGRNAKAKKFFEGLSYSKKNVLVRALDVKNADVRKERIAKTVDQLKAERA